MVREPPRPQPHHHRQPQHVADRETEHGFICDCGGCQDMRPCNAESSTALRGSPLVQEFDATMNHHEAPKRRPEWAAPRPARLAACGGCNVAWGVVTAEQAMQIWQWELSAAQL